MKNIDKLISLLTQHPDLCLFLTEALETERFFISISYQKVKDPKNPHLDLQHWWKRNKYNKDDVLNSLKHVMSDWIAKDNPTAELPDSKEWH